MTNEDTKLQSLIFNINILFNFWLHQLLSAGVYVCARATPVSTSDTWTLHSHLRDCNSPLMGGCLYIYDTTHSHVCFPGATASIP